MKVVQCPYGSCCSEAGNFPSLAPQRAMLSPLPSRNRPSRFAVKVERYYFRRIQLAMKVIWFRAFLSTQFHKYDNV
jgi:hypothetical protein